MDLIEKPFGELPDGRAVRIYTLKNGHGLTLSLTDLGAAVTSLLLPDRKGRAAEVVLGLQRPEDYLDDPHNLGGTIGRVANRISGAEFSLHGRRYLLAANAGSNHLHGGLKRFNKVLWSAEPMEERGAQGVRFSYLSPDGEEGYPGNLEVAVTILLTEADELVFRYLAETDQETPVNLTNHAYWNLAGAGSGPVLGHLLAMPCDRYLPLGDALIPTGEIAPTAGTPLDFSREKRIGADIQAAGGGYDRCLIIAGSAPRDQAGLRLAARVREPASGRTMAVYTDQPGVQLYTGNFLDDLAGAKGAVFVRQGGLCLETQNFPDAVNRPSFPSPFLKPGERYQTTTVHRFGISGEG